MNIKEIPKEGKKLSIKRDNAWFMDMVGEADIDVESLAGDMTAAVTVRQEYTKSVVIEGSAHVDVVLQCVKCLQSFHKTVDTDFSVVLEPFETSPAAHHAIAKHDLDAEFYVHDEFDPETVVFEQIMLGLPLYPLCTPGCKGLCPSCGTNLNEHPEHTCSNNKDAGTFKSQLEKLKL